jgi:hypothetical protein
MMKGNTLFGFKYLFLFFFSWKNINDRLKLALFIFGTYSCDNEYSLIRDIYPYLLFLLLIILEKKAMHFLQEKQQKKYDKSTSFFLSLKNIGGDVQKFKISSEFERKDLMNTIEKLFKPDGGEKHNKLKHKLSSIASYIKSEEKTTPTQRAFSLGNNFLAPRKSNSNK